MATTVSELAKGQRATERDGILELERMYVVTLDAASSTGQASAIYATGIPAYGDQWPTEITGKARPLVVSKTAQLASEDDHRYVYHVTVTYSTDARKTTIVTITQPDTLPWNRTPLYDYDFIEREEEMEEDADGTKVVNSVGDRFDPPVLTSRACGKIVISRATQSYNFSTALTYYNTINSGAVTIEGHTYDAKTLRLLRWSGKRSIYTKTDGTTATYYEETIEIEARKLKSDGTSAFNIYRRNDGYFQIQDSVRRHIYVGGVGGQPTTIPQPINPDTNAWISDPAGPFYAEEFHPFAQTSWSGLSLV